MTSLNDLEMTRREFLTHKVLLAGADWFTALEAVASTLLAHPEWDTDEIKTFEEWSKK